MKSVIYDEEIDHKSDKICVYLKQWEYDPYRVLHKVLDLIMDK